MSPARVRTQTARSGVERTNHEATAPPLNRFYDCKNDNWETRPETMLFINLHILFSKTFRVFSGVKESTMNKRG